jgi:adenylosuccinate synthase
MKVDIVVDQVAGDSGKGKVVHSLLASNPEYTHVCRTNAGNYCGHTIFHQKEKMVTHLIPAGVFWDKKSIICGGCVVNVASFFEELEYLEKRNIPASKLVKVAYNAHIVTSAHLEEENNETKIGTTKKGIGPCYRDKYARTGFRAEDVRELKPYLIDTYKEFYQSGVDPIILCEGAQGFYLDIDSSEYPYVTSSHCTSAGALLGNFSPLDVRNIIGCCKAYDTYVGNKGFQPEGEIFNQIAVIGNEVGATTGRKRQVNFLNLDNLIKSVCVNGCTELIVNKMDVLQKVNCWKMLVNWEIVDLQTENNFKTFLEKFVTCPIRYSYSAETI